MKTKYLLLLLISLIPGRAGAGEFRFIHEETTGLCNSVRKGNDKGTTIVITKDSNPETVALLMALLDKKIYGTRGVEDHLGAKWEQRVILIGEFVSEIRASKDAAGRQHYRDFHMTGIKVLFPVSRFVELDPVDGPEIIETHFSFESLFPKGVTLNGKAIDLGKHAIKRFASK